MLRANLIANIAGRVLTAVISFAFIPLYIRFLGMEAYGLVGFFAVIQSFAGILDLGFSTTVNRELARYSALPDHGRQARDLVRTLETIYWSVGLVVGLIVFAFSGLLARRWVQPERLSPDVIHNAIALMALVLVLQWPYSFYQGALLGLQKMMRYNVLHVSLQLLRAGGAVVVLMLSPTVTSFFAWQVAASGVSAVLIAVTLWKSLPGESPARFSMPLLRSVWRFAADLAFTSLVSLALMQADKIVLSKKLPLDTFGFYTLAATVASSLSYLVSPIATTFFPRLSQNVAAGDEATLRSLYHLGSSVMTTLVAPVGLVIAIFSRELVFLWTGDATAARATAMLIPLLIAGTLLNALMTVPYMLQVAWGWTRLAAVTNLIMTIVQIPLLVVAVERYGSVGAAAVWVGVNIVHLLVPMQIMYMRILPTEKWRWYGQDVALPLLAAAVVVIAARNVVDSYRAVVLVPALGATGLLAAGAAAFAAPSVRAQLMKWRPAR